MNNEPIPNLPVNQENINFFKLEKTRIMKGLLNAKKMDSFKAFNNEIAEFVEKEMLAKYDRGILEDTKLFHFLVGSSPQGSEPESYDLPSNEIQTFINSHFEKYRSML